VEAPLRGRSPESKNPFGTERSNTMKRVILSILAICLLTTGVAFAQSANTTAPGPTVQREPGQNSNNLPNPGNPQTEVGQPNEPAPVTGTGHRRCRGGFEDVPAF
jgi:hypothetical protein